MSKQLSAHFNEDEFKCHCGKCEMVEIDPELIDVLEDLITSFTTDAGRPTVTIVSGYRCPDHNISVGGAKNSQHCQGIAADIKMKRHNKELIPANTVYEFLNMKYRTKYGVGKYKTWTHIDVRPNVARWEG
jgi:uncharacterized protein YcbK (DUF882 family)